MYGEFKYGELSYSEYMETPKAAEIEFSTNLINYLPSYFRKENNKKLMKVIDIELGLLNYYSRTLKDQASIKKASWGLSTWEKELDIEYNPTMSLESRREVALAKLRGRGTTTKEMIINAAESFSGGEVNVIEKPEEFHFIVQFISTIGIPRNMDKFIEMLDTIKPSHVNYSFKYTYTTCQMLIDWGVTCDDIKDVTCKELKTYEKEVS